MLERAKLVIDDTAVVDVPIELERRKSQNEAGRSRVADEAL